MNGCKRRQLVDARIAAGDERAIRNRAAHAQDSLEEDRLRPLDLGAGPSWCARFEYGMSRLAALDARRSAELNPKLLLRRTLTNGEEDRMRLIDLTGRRFGDLTVLRRADEDYLTRGGVKFPRWDVRCACGRTATVLGHHLRAGKTRRCNTCHSELLSARWTKHRTVNGTPAYRAALSSGVKPSTVYARIGRGIPVDRAVDPTPIKSLTINGETLPIKYWLRRTGISRQAYHQRLARGMAPEQAATMRRQDSRAA